MFRDSQFGNGRPAVVLMHGCSGMWKDSPHQTGFPSASCPAGLSADALAECQADGQALQFMNSRL